MRIPGFAVESPARDATAGDRVHPQFFTCEEELAPVCRHRCKGAHNPRACVRRCLDKACSEKW
ncbi:hypothetical protein ACFY8W_03250 [Streptomyces sp. NPDC012637]|uniref:hypothetical protein n=1 Tax=Streptomyces sp. NPDC012637 TaxID=3364842 RepID=UPI0036EF9382